jgi:hypothetical protein
MSATAVAARRSNDEIVVMYTRRCLLSGLFVAALVSAQEAPATIQITGAVKQFLTPTAEDLPKNASCIREDHE